MNNSDWMSLTGSAYAGVRGGFRPMREPRHVTKAAAPPSKRQAVAAAKQRRRRALLIAQATAPTATPAPVRQRVPTTVLHHGWFALASPREQLRTLRTLQYFHGPRPGQ